MNNIENLERKKSLIKFTNRLREFLADEGAEQCGFCSPGFIMNVLAMARELQNPTLDEIKEYLAGNLCRCTGYMGQLRAIKKYIEVKNAEKKGGKEE